MATTDNSPDRVYKYLNNLIGQKCWSVIAGSGTGSMVSLAFGEKFRSIHKSRNNALTKEQQEYDGEFKIFIQQARWNLSVNDKVICTDQDTNETNGIMLSSLKQIVDKQVNSIQLISHTGSFKVIFANNFSLNVYCEDFVDDFDDNYSLFDKNNILTVGNMCQILVEPCERFKMDNVEQSHWSA